MEQSTETIQSRGAKILPALDNIIDLYMFHDARHTLKEKNQER